MVPAKKYRGRPKRFWIYAVMTARLRAKGRSLRRIHGLLNATLKLELCDTGAEGKPYFRAARRWADSGDASLAAFRNLTDEQEILITATRWYEEALSAIDMIMAGQLIDIHWNVLDGNSDVYKLVQLARAIEERIENLSLVVDPPSHSALGTPSPRLALAIKGLYQDLALACLRLGDLRGCPF